MQFVTFRHTKIKVHQMNIESKFDSFGSLKIRFYIKYNYY